VGGLILICEDDRMVADCFAEALEDPGYRAFVARDAEDALRPAAEVRPDAIILDLMLPGLDGAAALARLKAHPRTAAIPVVVASTAPGQLTFLDRSQAAAVLEKPFHLAELEAAISLALTPA
jgi:DNA-binding response OmpR family regulator